MSAPGPIAQLEERLNGIEEVVGSSPTGSTAATPGSALEPWRAVCSHSIFTARDYQQSYLSQCFVPNRPVSRLRRLRPAAGTTSPASQIAAVGVGRVGPRSRQWTVLLKCLYSNNSQSNR